MRNAIVLAAISVLAAYATVPRHAAQEPHITMLHVKVVKDPVTTADMLSPQIDRSSNATERAVASLEGR
jgi:hypothetical protein